MHSLRLKIALFLGLASFLPLLVGVTLCMRIYEQSVHEQSAKAQAAIAQALPAAVESLEISTLALCADVAQAPEIISAIQMHDRWNLMAGLGQSMAAKHFNFAEVTRPNGEVVLDLSDTTAVGQASTNPLIRQALAQVQAAGWIRRRDETVLAAARQILIDQKTIGVLSVGYVLDQELLYRIGRGLSEQVTAWKGAYQNSMMVAGKSSLPSLDEILSETDFACIDSGGFVTKTVRAKHNGFLVTIFGSIAASGNDAVYLAAYHSINYLIEAGLWARFHLLTTTTSIILLMFAFALWTSKRITEPLARLTAASRRLAAFDFSERIPASGRDEIAELAAAFNHLSEQLQKNMLQKDQYAARLAELNDNLERIVASRTEDLVNANLRLKNAAAEKEDLLRAVSHDLGAPLRNIAGIAHLLEQKHGAGLGLEGIEKLARIRNNVRHDLQMIEQLLDISRIKHQRGGTARIDLNELLAQIRNDLCFTFEKESVQLVINEILPVIYSDRNRVRQLFQNLIDNSIKYMGDQTRPKIDVGWAEEEKIYLFWVSDNGMGIPADQKDKIFGIFRRVKNSQTAQIEGKGVGLAVVKSIVEVLGGEIWVESRPSIGSTFYFTMARSLVENPSGDSHPRPEHEALALPT